ncbi:MAG: HK97 gp10 family phage protein [Candidatus Limnocylindrus sp.]
MSAADLARIARAIPELGSDETVRRAMDRVKPTLLAEIRATQRAKFGRRTGIMARSIKVADIHRGLSAQVGSRAFYARIWEGGRRPFVAPSVDGHLATAERLIVAEIEGVAL